MNLYLQGVVAMNRARYPAAADILARSLAILEKIVGSEHMTLALIGTSLAALYQQSARYDEALSLLQRMFGFLRGRLEATICKRPPHSTPSAFSI